MHRDRLIIRLKSDNADQASDSPEDRLLSIPWRKPPSKKSRQMLLPHNASRSDVRPEQFERRARLVVRTSRNRFAVALTSPVIIASVSAASRSGFLAGVVRKKLGLNLVSEPTEKYGS